MDENEHGRRADPFVSREGRALIVHASAVAWPGRGVLIRGASGTGKSGLALRLIALGATLVADDRLLLQREGDRVTAEAPEPLAGLIEARGVGLLRMKPIGCAPVVLVVDLDRAPEARMPDPRKTTLLGCDFRLLFGRGVPNLDAIITLVAQERADLV